MKELIAELKKGKIITFSSEKYQQSIGGDDIREAELSYDFSSFSHSMVFRIWFNGKLVHLSKGSISFVKKLNSLIQNFNLERLNN